MTATVANSAIGTAGTVSFTIANLNDLILVASFTSIGGGTPFITSIASTLGNTINNSVKGTFNTSSSYWIGGTNYYVSLFWGYATHAGAETLTLSYNGGKPGTASVAGADCSGVATSGAVLTNIYNYQATPGTTANAVTVAGGTGSDSVNIAPALILAFGNQASGTLSAGTGFTSASANASGLIEYERVASTGVVDATATANANVPQVMWQIALAEAGATTPAPNTMGRRIYILP